MVANNMVANTDDKVYRSFYTKSDPIVNYMVTMLELKPEVNIFEPCAGDGVFIDALIRKSSNLLIDAYELNPNAISILKEKYRSYSSIKIKQADTLLCPDLYLLGNIGGIYDRIIANPPYGGWQDLEKRQVLKKLYPKLYVKETYALFLYRCVQLLKENGILVFIIPDTFLNLHMHTRLREFLLTNTKIEEILLFPSSFFPGVNFGYANLSIISLKRIKNKKDCLNNTFQIITGFKNVEEIDKIKTKKTNFETYSFTQNKIYNNIDHAIFISENPKITNMINDHYSRIGDIAECVTGFYSGNDKGYLYSLSAAKKKAKYKVMDKNLICHDYLKEKDLLGGVEGKRHFIPILKGGGIKYFKPEFWYMDWSKEAVKNYKTEKKARFQNSDYYFKFGVGIPMVSSSQITGALIENKLFDQSIVGVFPKDNRYVYYLLAFVNSPTCNKLIRTINPSANNSANYIKKIPIILPNQIVLEKISEITKKIVKSLKETEEYGKELELTLHNIIKSIYGF